MKMLIDKIKLKLILEEKRDYIRNNIEGVDIVITAIIFMITLSFSNFKTTFGINEYVLGTIAWVIAVLILIYGIYKIKISCSHKYNHKALFSDIENLDEILHKFSLVAIKDTFNDCPNRFLLYFDKAWECWLFLNYKTSEIQNENIIIARLSNTLKIDIDKLKLEYISDRLQPKYSERDKKNKVYQHTLYKGTTYYYTDDMKKDQFEIEGIQYKWFTIEEMENNEIIMDKNEDVVAFVKEKVV